MIDYVEIESPVYEQWPPASHQRIFKKPTRKDQEIATVEEILLRFMRKAWRRPVSQEEVDRKLTLFRKVRPLCGSFEEAAKEVLAAVIASPHFVYLGGAMHDERKQTAEDSKKLDATNWQLDSLSFFGQACLTKN